ncbi:MAG: hypothetical protein CVV10_09450, partial [Gammaproteobacteria bacterium HGW-Gammaproteobacteria-14]
SGSRDFGSHQHDAVQRMTGSINFNHNELYGLVNNATGIFTQAGQSRPNRLTGDGTHDPGRTNSVNFDSADQVRSAGETRPTNIAWRWIIWTN